MNTNFFDYSIFEASLNTMRRMNAYVIGLVPHAIDAGLRSPAGKCKLIERTETHDVIDVSSLCRPTSGDDWLALEWQLGQPIPKDFAAFHALYSEAIVVTRTQPIHLYSLEEILEQIAGNTITGPNRKPRRFFRFGGTYQTDYQYYGLRQTAPDSPDWEVILAAQQPDEFLEGAKDFAEYEDWAENHEVPKAIAPSFYHWLKHLIETDGMEDQYLEPVSPGGAWYDPA